MNNQEKIEAAVEKKEEGNALFKVGKYPRASRRYETVCSLQNRVFLCQSSNQLLVSLIQFCQTVGIEIMQAAKYIEYDTDFSEEEKKQRKTLKISCNLNNAACKLKLKDYSRRRSCVPRCHQIRTCLLISLIYFYLFTDSVYFSCWKLGVRMSKLFTGELRHI